MKVEIYTKPYCAYCERAKELLRIKGIPFTEYVINGNSLRSEELRRRTDGDAVPRIFVGDQLIGGCSELFSLDERGALDPLLKALSAETP